MLYRRNIAQKLSVINISYDDYALIFFLLLYHFVINI